MGPVEGEGEYRERSGGGRMKSSSPPVADSRARSERRGTAADRSLPRRQAGSPEPPIVGEVPSRVRGYRITKTLGRGGMGAVYLARQWSLDRNVVLRVMGPQWANDPVFVSRFAREAYAAAQLVHPNLVQIHDLGEERGTPYVSVEFVDGRPLSHLVGRGRSSMPKWPPVTSSRPRAG